MVSFTVYPTGTAIAQELAADVDECGYFLCRLCKENPYALGDEIAHVITNDEVEEIAAWLRNFADAIEASKEREDL